MSSLLLDGVRMGVLLASVATGCALSPDAAARPQRGAAALSASVASSPAPAGTADRGRVTAAAADDGDRAALRTAADEAYSVLARRVAKPDATAETRRVARGLELLREALQQPGAEAFDEAMAARFASGPPSRVFVTGYHEPTLAARRARDGRFRHPIYRLPEGRAALPSRAEIDAGALSGRGLELFWTDDPVELFFLHIQGSGRLQLEDGSVVRVGYAGNNGKTYRAIGSVLVERGVFRREEATAPAVKAYLRANPGEALEIMHTNPRYVFFAPRDGRAEQGPRGALGVPLVPYRSVAVDPAVVPLGSVGHLRVPLPGGDTFSAVVVAMDTGTAIKGPGRIDLFCGPDDEAARIAGELRHEGELVWLAPRRPTGG